VPKARDCDIRFADASGQPPSSHAIRTVYEAGNTASSLPPDAALTNLQIAAVNARPLHLLTDEFGAVPSGLFGVSRNGWLWEYTHEYLYAQLSDKYALSHSADPDSSDYFNTVLTTDLAGAEAGLTVARTPALNALDLKSCQTRLLASPVASSYA